MAIKLTTKEFDVEEQIEFLKGEEVYFDFTMKLTKKEVKEIEEIITGVKHKELAMNLSKAEHEKDFDNVIKIEKELHDLLLQDQNRFVEICFKENHKVALESGVPEDEILEMVEVLHDFFWKAFIKKRGQQINSMNSDLRKIGAK